MLDRRRPGNSGCYGHGHTSSQGGETRLVLAVFQRQLCTAGTHAVRYTRLVGRSAEQRHVSPANQQRCTLWRDALLNALTRCATSTLL